MVQGSNPCAGTKSIFLRNPDLTARMRVTRPPDRARSDCSCLLRALGQSTVVTEPQCPHCTLLRLLSPYRRLPAGVAAPGPVNRALGANELAEDAHLHSTQLLIDLVGATEDIQRFRADTSYQMPHIGLFRAETTLDIIHVCVGATPSSGSASWHWWLRFLATSLDGSSCGTAS